MRHGRERWLRSGVSPSSPPGITLWPTSPTRWWSRASTLLAGALTKAADRFFDRLPLQGDRYDGKFFLAAGGVLGFTLVSYWALVYYAGVKWFTGEDGLSEWWSVATYLVAAALAAVTARSLTRLGHPRIGWFHVLLALVFIFGALEEVSWGQRLFGWSTPEGLASVNDQQETTLHNITSFNQVLPTVIFVASLLALVGAAFRAISHHHRLVTTADFILPSLVIFPAVLIIATWVGGLESFPGNILELAIPALDLRPGGSEVPEVLMGLAICLYTYANVKRARALRSRKPYT